LYATKSSDDTNQTGNDPEERSPSSIRGLIEGYSTSTFGDATRPETVLFEMYHVFGATISRPQGQ
jgi:hypothetical protein